jgi:hypothetical protein
MEGLFFLFDVSLMVVLLYSVIRGERRKVGIAGEVRAARPEEERQQGAGNLGLFAYKERIDD